MRLSATYHCLGLLLALLTGSLSACQRASYSFTVPPSAYQHLSPPPAALGADSSVAATVVARLPLVPASSRVVSRPTRPRLRHVLAGVAQAKKAMRAARRYPPAAIAPAARPQADPLPAGPPVPYRSHTIAVLLAILSITYLPLSLHNFYLGYYGRGAAAIALLVVGTYMLFLGFIGSFFGGGNLSALGYVGLLLLLGWFVWQLSDLGRILLRELKPKGGDYRPRQPRSTPNPPPAR